ncbi:MAG: leucine-rich repeat domain-containing protein, partial [Eubacteriales bacterium]
EYIEYGGDNGYKYASSLSSVVIPEGVETIGDYAFMGCSLDTVSLPSSLEKVGAYAFDGVLENGNANIDFSKLTSLKTIGKRAFAYCDAVREVNLSPSVENVGKYAFLKTGAMEKFISKSRETESTDDDFWISGDGILLLCMVKNGETEINVPDGVKIIAGGAFAGWDSGVIYNSNEGITDKYWYNAWNIDKLDKITLPDTVRTICDGAFVSASSLEEINIPDNVTSIGDEAFFYCKNLSKISLGKGVRSVGYRAFAYSGLVMFNEEESGVVYFGDEVFWGCAKLKAAIFPNKADFFGTDLFVGCNEIENICISRDFEPRIYEIVGNDLYSSSTRSAFNINYYEK